MKNTQISNEQLKNELGQIITDYNASHKINIDLVDEATIDELTKLNIEAREYMTSNPYSSFQDEEKENEAYKHLTQIYNKSRDLINNISVKYSFLGSQLKAVKHVVYNAEYSAESLFYGVKIDNAIFSKMDKTKLGNEDKQEFEVSILLLTMLHTILLSTPLKGLSYESYLVAKTLIDITEYVKVYNHLSIQLDKLSKSIDSWEQGIEVTLK